METSLADRITGMFFGIAIGDALFMPVEDFSADKIAWEFGKITDYQKPRNHKWFKDKLAGTWTDNTALTLVTAESLTACGKIDIDDLAKRHLMTWKKEGDPGFGSTTRDALKRLEAGVHWSLSGIPDKSKSGRGTGNAMPMKIAPVAAFSLSPICNYDYSTDIINYAFITHRTRIAAESALIHVAAIRHCLNISSHKFLKRRFIKDVIDSVTPLNFIMNPEIESDSLTNRISSLADLPLEKIENGDISKLFGNGSTYVYDSLPFSYSFFLKNPFSIETLYNVGNAGGDTDTNSSIVGGMLGALNGMSIFPAHLVSGLKEKHKIEKLATGFYNKFFQGGY